jgi:hypothetical protein
VVSNYRSIYGLRKVIICKKILILSGKTNYLGWAQLFRLGQNWPSHEQWLSTVHMIREQWRLAAKEKKEEERGRELTCGGCCGGSRWC